MDKQCGLQRNLHATTDREDENTDALGLTVDTVAYQVPTPATHGLLEAPNVNVAAYGALMLTISYSLQPILVDTGSALNATVCMTHARLRFCVAVPVYGPTVAANSSSSRSPLGLVIIRVVNPPPELSVTLSRVAPATSMSFAMVVDNVPLDIALPVPDPDATESINGEMLVILEYSAIRTSGNCGAELNVTVTILAPAAAATILLLA